MQQQYSYVNDFVFQSGQNFELYSYGRDCLELVDCIRAHPRNLTDLDWSPFDSNSLATCAVDDAVHIWDIRFVVLLLL